MKVYNCSIKAFKQAKNECKRLTYLSYYSDAELKQLKRFKIKGVNAGFCVKNDELVNLFNASQIKGIGGELVKEAIKKGVKRLDCFDGFLPKFYSQFGFKEVNRIKWDDNFKPKNWNSDDKPDIVFMSL